MASFKFTNGKTYDLVTLDDLDLDETLIFWDYTQMGLDEVPNVKGFHPGVVMALMHCSIRRAEPNTTERELRAEIGKTKFVALGEIFDDISEEVPDPPVALEPKPSGSSAHSGEPSEPTGETGPSDPNGQNGTGSPSLEPSPYDPATSAD